MLYRGRLYYAREGRRLCVFDYGGDMWGDTALIEKHLDGLFNLHERYADVERGRFWVWGDPPLGSDDGPRSSAGGPRGDRSPEIRSLAVPGRDGAGPQPASLRFSSRSRACRNGARRKAR